MKPVLYLSVLFIFSLSLISCKKKAKSEEWNDTLHAGLIRISCDEHFRELMDNELMVFEAHYPDAAIIPIYTSEQEAIRLLTEDSVRFALVTRDLNPSEQKKLTDRAMEARKNLIAFDGVALIIHPANKDSLISLPVLRKILRGEITEWSQVNRTSSLGTIRVIFDNRESSVLRYAVDSIVRGDTFSPNLYALNDYLEVIEKVRQMPNAIGLIGINALQKEAPVNPNLPDIRLMRLSKEDPATVKNSYLPYAGDIMQENYPLWRPVYILLSDPRSGLSSGLSIFLAHEVGQKIILQSGLLPITDPQNLSVNISDEFPK
ncbi:MAG: substrate-binding domain-containing protein [Candidatus Azobacteroides sp.]|nr:substrate-binding domain-containing protein [Candidatus Azobacteroides sp.]